MSYYKKLVCLVTITKDVEELFCMEAPICLPPALYTVCFEFTRYLGNEEKGILGIHMSAKMYNDDLLRFRADLLESKYITRLFSVEDGEWDKYPGPPHVFIDDQKDVIATVFPDIKMDDFFNQTTKQLNDKSLRLPS